MTKTNVKKRSYALGVSIDAMRDGVGQRDESCLLKDSGYVSSCHESFARKQILVLLVNSYKKNITPIMPNLMQYELRDTRDSLVGIMLK